MIVVRLTGTAITRTLKQASIPKYMEKEGWVRVNQREEERTWNNVR